MAELVRKQPAGILERREWWSLSDTCEAMVVYGKEICSIHITNSNREDISKELVAKLLEKTGVSLSTTATIDSYFIECEEEKVVGLLADLESVC